MRSSILNLDREESFEQRIGGWLEAGCLRLMRAGGGPLSQEHPERQRTELGRRVRLTTPEQDAEILRFGRAGKLTGTQIAHAVGVRPNLVRNRLVAAGIRVPDGRL